MYPFLFVDTVLRWFTILRKVFKHTQRGYDETGKSFYVGDFVGGTFVFGADKNIQDGVFSRSVDSSWEHAAPEKRSQHLDIFGSISEVSTAYNGGKTTAFVEANYPVIAVRKRFSGEPPKSYTFGYDFSERGNARKKPLHMTYKVDGGEIAFYVAVVGD